MLLTTLAAPMRGLVLRAAPALRRFASRRGAAEATGEEAFVEVVLYTAPDDETPGAGELSEVLLEFGALSATTTDTRAGTDDEEAVYAEPAADPFLDGGDAWSKVWTLAEIRALFATRAAGEAALASLRDIYGDRAVDALDAAVAPLPVTDWVEAQEAARPVVAFGDLEILLPWHDASPDPAVAARQLKVEGGAAFGTGEHETTALCGEWLQRASLPPLFTMVDYGCGSGILALTALRRGAATAVGVDIDGDCVAAAKRNAASNGMPAARFFLPPRDAGAGPAEIAYAARSRAAAVGHEPLPGDELPADVVVANILLRPLLELRATLTGLVRPGGTLAISGVRRDQFDAVRAAYGPSFASVDIEAERGGWLLVICADRAAT